MRRARAISLAALAVVLTSCGEDKVPQYVAGPISGLQLGCTEDGQKAPEHAAYITRADIDGDGKPDHFVDTAKGCKANRLLYCSDEGCVVNLYLTTWESTASPSFRTVSFTTAVRSGRTEIDVRSGGAACAVRPDRLCQRTLVFNGTDLVEAPAR